jgi:Fungal specific transcription factor domain
MDTQCVDTSITDMPALIDHNDFTQNSVAVNPEGSFFDFALTDAALMHAMLSLVALHLDLNNKDATVGRIGYLQAIHHQAEAVRDVNRRLSTPGPHMSDGLVGAVAILANGEVRSRY